MKPEPLKRKEFNFVITREGKITLPGIYYSQEQICSAVEWLINEITRDFYNGSITLNRIKYLINRSFKDVMK